MEEKKSLLPAGTALAGSVVAISLLETLHDKGVLSLSESRSVLERANRALGPLIGTNEGAAAHQIIASALRNQFSERR